MKCLGQLPVMVTVGDKSMSCNIHIIEHLTTVLLSWATTRDLSLIHKSYIASAEAKVFTTFDALKGYHKCPLDEESQLLTTFITPFGHWMYLRALYGVSSISEHYSRRMETEFQGMSQFAKLADDVVVYDKSHKDHTHRVREFLQRVAWSVVSPSIRTNFVFAQPKVTFAGYELSSSGYSVDPQLVLAINDFPEPTNITELRSFFGLVNQLSLFTDQIAELLQPLHPLLSAQNEYVRDAAHSPAFMTAKSALASPPTLSFYDPSRPTSLRNDASRLHGLGFIPMQKQDDDS